MYVYTLLLCVTAFFILPCSKCICRDRILVSSVMSEARQNSYPEIIHALDHEHTRRNFERHVQVIGKWSRACGDG